MGLVVLVAFLVGMGISGLIWGLKPAKKFETKVYENKDLHLKFSYSDMYFLSEKIDEKSHSTSSVFLLNDTKENRDIASFDKINLNNISNAIAVEIFDRDNAIDISDWVKKNTVKSHFDLSDQKMETASVGDKKIVYYSRFNDLKGSTIALINQGKVYLFTVVFTSDSDKVNKDFTALLSSLELI